MARPKKDEAPPPSGTVNGEVPQPDFKKGIRILTTDLNPLEEKSAKIRGDQSAAWKAIEKDCHLNKKAAKTFHGLLRSDPELRDDWFRTFQGLLEASGIGITRDLVDQAEGNDDKPIIPVVERERPKLVTVD